MRLLYLSHCLPYPPNKGDRVRAYHALRYLSSRGHQIHLLAIVKPAEEIQEQSALEEICDDVEVFPLNLPESLTRCALGTFGGAPLTHSYFHSRRLNRWIQGISDRGCFEAVVAYSSAMAPYAQRLESHPRVLDMVDVDSAKWQQYSARTRGPRRWVYGLEARRLRRFEARVGRDFEQIVVATRREENLLRSIDPDADIATIRNGVSTDFYESSLEAKSPEPTLVFTGQMDYLPNVDASRYFVESVMPLVQKAYPDLRILIVGRSPSAEVRSLAGVPGVEVTGAVEDVRPFLARSWVFVAPLRMAQGIQNKVLEAMAMNLPVVCSRAVMAGLEDGGFVEGSEVLVGDDAAELADAVVSLLADRVRREAQTKKARARVESMYDWDRNMAALEYLIENSVQP